MIYVIAALPSFGVLALLLRKDVGFWPALAAGCAVAMIGYVALGWMGRRYGLPV